MRRESYAEDWAQKNFKLKKNERKMETDSSDQKTDFSDFTDLLIINDLRDDF